MHEQLRVGNSVRLIRDVGERRAGTSGTVVGYYVDSGVTVVTFADGTADVPRHMLELAAEDAPLGRDLPSRRDSGELVPPTSDVLYASVGRLLRVAPARASLAPGASREPV